MVSATKGLNSPDPGHRHRRGCTKFWRV